tara:strand:+ start:329 stop:541 length:213 start_codon:yes stop_codon:yes gene_type:complete
MKFRKEYIEDQFRGFETSRDSGNNIAVVRVKKDNDIVAVWKVCDSRNLDAVIADAINTAIARGIVPAGTV